MNEGVSLTANPAWWVEKIRALQMSGILFFWIALEIPNDILLGRIEIRSHGEIRRKNGVLKGNGTIQEKCGPGSQLLAIRKIHHQTSFTYQH